MVSPHPSLYFFLQFLFQLYLMSIPASDEISMEDPLCDSSLGSMVTLDYVTLLTDPVIINLQSTKVYVFSDSVLCLGKVVQHPECNEAWKNRVERSYRDYETVSGESTEFEWNIFPGFTSLLLCDKINNLLSSLGQTPETFTGRILFYVNVQ